MNNNGMMDMFPSAASLLKKKALRCGIIVCKKEKALKM